MAGSIGSGVAPPSPPPKRDPKRPKQGDKVEENSASKNLISAVPETGADRTQ
jgi:hypothetical protein